MKLNWAERCLVNSPVRLLAQHFIMRWVRKSGALRPGGRLLEVGCGRGAGARLILREFQPAQLAVLDLDRDMVGKARAHLRPELDGRVSVYVGDATHLPYREGLLDGVFALGVLHHVPRWREALKEIARVLRPGGVYVVEEFYPPLYLNFLARRLFRHPEEDRFDSPELHRALKGAGFTLTESLEAKKLGLLAVAVKEG